jgi:hypothetical protein
MKVKEGRKIHRKKEGTGKERQLLEEKKYKGRERRYLRRKKEAK